MTTERVEALYDRLPYPDLAFWFTHPDQLAVMATLFGMQPAPPEACRVLELGSAVGGNLLPMAASLPQSRFVGVDLSGVQTERARAAAEATRLSNVDFVQADLRDLGPELGAFDYIIAHGLYSWVPDAVRDGLLALVRARLAPQGVAYISYNTLPGWHGPTLVRDLMRLHTAPFDDPARKVEQGLVILDWLAERASRTQGDWRAAMLAAERAGMRTMTIPTVLHDYLAPDHQPVYFQDFVAHCRAHDLAYLAEAKPWDMHLENFDADVISVLGQVSGLVQQQQYLDFVVNRRFRMSLLCRAETRLERRVDGRRTQALYASATLEDAPGLGALASAAPVPVTNRRGRTLTVPSVIGRLALAALRGHGREGQPFETTFTAVLDGLARLGLETEARASDAGRAELRRRLASQLLRLFFGELVSFTPRRLPIARELPERPETGRLQRWQATHGAYATTLCHEHLPLDADARALLAALDGRHDRHALAERFPHLPHLDVDDLLARFLQAGYLIEPAT